VERTFRKIGSTLVIEGHSVGCRGVPGIGAE
jgi:hypothetical protein